MATTKNKDPQGKLTRKLSAQPSDSGALPEDWGAMIKDIKDLVTQVTTDLKVITSKTTEIEESVRKLTDKTQSIDSAIKRLGENQGVIKKKQREMQEELEQEKRLRQSLQDQVALMELKQKELYLRFRNVPVLTPEENMRDVMVTAISKLLDIEGQEIDKMIESIYRIKTPYGKRIKEPGDCLILFNSRKIRDRILQTHFQRKMVIADHNIIILKEIPYSLLQKRKSYRFLTEALKKNCIFFCWEFPEGLSFNFKGRRFKLTEPLKAEEFQRKYKRELGGVGPTLEREEEIEDITTTKEDGNYGI